MELLYLIYMLLLCGFLPLYMNAGYIGLGEAKAMCYLIFSIPIAVALIVLELIKNKAAIKESIANLNTETKSGSLAEFFLYGSLFSCLISFVFSGDKKTAFLGYEGWRNGLLTMLVAMAFCILIRKRGFFRSHILILFFLVPFFEFILSILNRMSLYPFSIAGQDVSFLATLGNINWFSGYLSIWVPLGIGFMFVQKRFSLFFWLSGLYTVAGLVALFMQGSDGASLIIVASFGLLFLFGVTDRDRFKSFLIQVFVLGLSMTVVDILMLFADSYYNYAENLLIKACESHAGLILMAAAFFVYRVSRLFEEIKVTFFSKIYARLFIAVLFAGVAFGAYMLISTFNDSFGNGRGIIWKMCAELYGGLTSWQKLVGVGQDCLYSFAMSDGYWNSSFTNVFGSAALTNAHCEFLTILIERGLIGAITYVGLFGSVMIQLIKAKEKEHAAFICALPILSYFVYNQISFAQVTSLPYCLILIGIALSLSGNRE